MKSGGEKQFMKQKKTTEDYLKTIYILKLQKKSHGADIARALGVSRPTVSTALKALEQEGYVWMDKSRIVHLTDHGLRIARDTYERHQTFQELLICLGVDQETAAHDACEMEHSVSPQSFYTFKAALEEMKGKAKYESALD